jgi:hypothetical protein
VVNKMKRSGTTLIFVIVWTAMLFASFVIGICIREVRFQYAKVESQADTEPDVSSEVQRPDATDQLVSELAQRRPMPASGSGGPQRRPSPEDRTGFGGDRMARMGERFEGMSEEERQEAIAQMRERFGGRRREGGMRGRFENMSEEERARMEEVRKAEQDRENYMHLQEIWPTLPEETREKIRDIQERWPTMSEEERDRVRAGNLD